MSSCRASGGSSSVAGSPDSRSSRKTKIETPSSTRTDWSSRRATKLAIVGRGGLLDRDRREVDPLVRQRLQILDLLAVAVQVELLVQEDHVGVVAQDFG